MKEKKTKSNIIYENAFTSHNVENNPVMTEDEISQSLLNGSIKKHKKLKKEKNSQSDTLQNESLLKVSESIFTDDNSDGNGSDKPKKRKMKHDQHSESQKKKARQIEFLTEDIFKQSSSEEFFNSTPCSTPKKVKKRHGKKQGSIDVCVDDKTEESSGVNSSSTLKIEKTKYHNEMDDRDENLNYIHEDTCNNAITSKESTSLTKQNKDDHIETISENGTISSTKSKKKKRKHEELTSALLGELDTNFMSTKNDVSLTSNGHPKLKKNIKKEESISISNNLGQPLDEKITELMFENASIGATKSKKKKRKHEKLTSAILSELDTNFVPTKDDVSLTSNAHPKLKKKNKKDKSISSSDNFSEAVDEKNKEIMCENVLKPKKKKKHKELLTNAVLSEFDTNFSSTKDDVSPIVKPKKKKKKEKGNSIADNPSETVDEKIRETTCENDGTISATKSKKKKRKYEELTNFDLDSSKNDLNGHHRHKKKKDRCNLVSNNNDETIISDIMHEKIREIMCDNATTTISSTKSKKKKRKSKQLTSSILSDELNNITNNNNDISPHQKHKKKKKKEKECKSASDNSSEAVDVSEYNQDNQMLALHHSEYLNTIGLIKEDIDIQEEDSLHSDIKEEVDESSDKTLNVCPTSRQSFSNDLSDGDISILTNESNDTEVNFGYDDENVSILTNESDETVINFTNDENKASRVDVSALTNDPASSSDDGVKDKDKANFKRIEEDAFAGPDFEVPQLHQILDRASKPTLDQRTEIAIQGLKTKFGKYTKIEDKQIKENWKYFIQTNCLDDNPEVFFRLDKRYIAPQAKKYFLYYLGRNMPERTPYSIFNRFKKLLGERKKGRFTQEENDYIEQMVKENKNIPGYMSEIAQHLQRPLDAIEKRIKLMKNIHTRKIKWKPNNAAAFIKYLLKVTKIPEENMQELKGRDITAKEWSRLSKELDDLPARILKRAWLANLHPALFIPDEFCDIRNVKFKLIKMFYDNNETEWRSVDWSRYSSHFEGLTNLKVFSLMKQLVTAHVPAPKRKNLKKCLKRLIKLQKEDIRKRVIYKIKYSNGIVVEGVKPKRRKKRSKGSKTDLELIKPKEEDIQT